MSQPLTFLFKMTRSAVSKLGALCVVALFVGNVAAQELFVEKSDVAPREIERIYSRGLQFLARSQSAEGFWPDTPYGSEPGVVGLAITTMLAHGDDPNFGPYSQNIRRGLDHILKQQNARNGYIGRSMYNHGFATLALAEAYGAVEDSRLGAALQKAVELILTSQEKNQHKAWRYSPESTDADTTVTGAQLMALFAARNAGVPVPEEAIQNAVKYLLSCQTPEGGFGYTAPNGPNAPRTAIGCLMLALAKEKKTREYEAGFKFLQTAPADQHYHHYYLYYASQAFFHASPASWQEWNRKNVRTLAATQNAEGGWDGQFGPTFTTSASLLSLALNYRYLPIYER